MLLRRYHEKPEKLEMQPDPASATDWGALTVAELKNELEARGLDTDGKKAELVARLEAAD